MADFNLNWKLNRNNTWSWYNHKSNMRWIKKYTQTAGSETQPVTPDHGCLSWLKLNKEKLKKQKTLFLINPIKFKLVTSSYN